MIKTKLFKTFCVVLAAGTICIIPANIMEASKTPAIVKNTDAGQRVKKESTAENKVSEEKKENGVIIEI